MLFTLSVRGDASINSAQGTQSVSNHLIQALRYLRANGWVLSKQHCGQPRFLSVLIRVNPWLDCPCMEEHILLK